MSRLRRIGVLLLLLGFLAGLAIAQVGPLTPPFRPPEMPAPAIDIVTLPTDRHARKRIEAALEYIQEQSWPEAVRLLQGLLDARSDVFLEPADATGKKRLEAPWISSRHEAERLLGDLPAAGREQYEVMHGPQARQLLHEARTKNDPGLADEVIRRFFHTDAGAEALVWLGTHHLDRGRAVLSAACFERLSRHQAAGNLPSLTWFKAVLAFHRAGDKAREENAWKRLAEKAPGGLLLGKETVRLDRLRLELKQMPAEPAGPAGWTLFRGDASRSGRGNGDKPFLEAHWQLDSAGHAETRRVIDQTALPAFTPLGVTLPGQEGAIHLTVYRSHQGVHAIDLDTGVERWIRPMPLSLDAVMADLGKKVQVQRWLQMFDSARVILIENSVLGSLSADQRRVYAVEDLPVPLHPAIMQMLQSGQPQFFGPLKDAVYHNKLIAFDLLSGAPAWELGGRQAGEWSDSYFLGPPLPLAGKLYVLNDKNRELRLACLDPDTGEVSWIQPLASARDSVHLDISRRIQACHPASAEGVLVCPTNTGAVVAVDLLTHSLLWAHVYQEQAPPASDSIGMRVWTTGRKASAPVIQDGNVVFTAPDSDAVICLNLHNGKQRWKVTRAPEDLYLAGVFDGKVVMVGTHGCRALRLTDGEPLWKVATGTPAGQGVATGNIYYLPLRNPALCAIDFDKGVVLSTSTCRPGETVGNLIFHNGDMVSQTARAVAAYPQLKSKLASIEQRIRANPRDPAALSERGGLRLKQDDVPGAIADLRLALVNRPDAATLGKARATLFEALTRLLERDFAGNENHLGEYRELCRVAVPDGATPQQRQQLRTEEQRRQRKLPAIVALGREQQGRLLDALTSYLELHRQTSDDEFMPVADDPPLQIRTDIWVRGRLEALFTNTTPVQRKAIDARIRQELQVLSTSPDTESLDRFASLLDPHSPTGAEARLQLAERLMDERERGRFLDAELQLLRLTGNWWSARDQGSGSGDQGSRDLSAHALETLARLTTRRGLLKDALDLYRVLGDDFPKVVVRDGKTGAEIFEELASDKRFLAELHRADPLSTGGKWKASEVPAPLRSLETPWPVTLQPEGNGPPFFRKHRLVFHLKTGQLKLLERETGVERWNLRLPLDNRARERLMMLQQVNDSTAPLPRFRVKGHLAIVQLNHLVYGLDIVERRLLWSRDLAEGMDLGANHSVSPDGQSDTQVMYESIAKPIGLAGPVTADSVCLQTLKGLIGVDPLRGLTLWTRSDIAGPTIFFGDERHLYLAEEKENERPRLRCLRMRDGVETTIPDLVDIHLGANICIRGRCFLNAATAEVSGGRTYQTLRLHDVHTGKDVWRKQFDKGTHVISCEGCQMTGVVEPSGKVIIFDRRTGQEVLRSAVDPAHLDKVDEIHLLQDRANVYLACYGSRDVIGHDPDPNNALAPGLRSLPVNGMVYCLDRATGKVQWFARMANQRLVLEQFEDLPVIFFVANQILPWKQKAPDSPGVVSIQTLDKQTGKLLYNRAFQQTGHPFHSLLVDRAAGTIDLVSANLRIRHTLQKE